MTNNTDNQLTPALKGAMIGLVLIFTSLIIYFTNNLQNKFLGYLPLGLFATGIIVACYYYSKQNNGNVTFGNVFAEGFKTSAAATGINLVYTYLALKFLMPDMIDIAIEATQKALVEKKMPADQIKQFLEQMKNYYVPFAIGGSLVFYLIIGLIASLIGAAIAPKNENANPFNQS